MIKISITILIVFVVKINAAFATPVSLLNGAEPLSELVFLDQDGQLNLEKFLEIKAQINELELSDIDQIIIQTIQDKFFKTNKNIHKITIDSIKRTDALYILAHEEYMGTKFVHFSTSAKMLLRKYKKSVQELETVEKTSLDDLKSLMNFEQKSLGNSDFDYRNGVRLFLVCREDRSYPCLFVMKDIWGEFVKEGDRIWSLPALAKSKLGYSFYQANGNTPTGVHLIDSVMPYADQNLLFGKFRRPILNWLPREDDGTELVKDFIPKEHFKLNWWKQASVARDAGRSNLRIHGTGRINEDKKTPYYPHVPTAGCVSTREGEYEDLTFKDQRLLLDKMIEASQLAPVFSSEEELRGVLYVYNLDNKKSKVTLDDLKNIFPTL